MADKHEEPIIIGDDEHHADETFLVARVAHWTYDCGVQVRAGEHFWIVYAAIRIPEPTQYYDILPTDVIRQSSTPVCFICTQEWSPTIAAMPCPTIPMGGVNDNQVQ